MTALPIEFNDFKKLIFTARDEWNYTDKEAGEYASEITIEDIYNKHELAGINDFKIDEIDLNSTLKGIAHDILSGSQMIDFKIDAIDPIEFEIIYSD